MSITVADNQWHIVGEILVDNANAILIESNALTMGDRLEVNFSAVTDLDTSALSLMMEWQRRAILSNVKILFTHVPETLSSLAVLYGVSGFIPLTEE